ncbi:MAG: purine-nucleoside phosphorylase [Deltaproteobacteria bacterium]|nr:purine-nucleoside phosphorylase [Deltaproteobacteria bacterium]
MTASAQLGPIVAAVRAKFPSLVTRPLDAAVVLGSGMSDAADAMTHVESVPYSEIPGFPAASVAGHSGRLDIGDWNDRRVAAFRGRFHYYEGHDGGAVTLPVRLAHALGAPRVVLTTAVGGLNPDFRAGDFMLIADHINLIGRTPFQDVPPEPGRSPFVNPRGMYRTDAIERLRSVAEAEGAALHVGVLAAMPGPAYETAAEKRMLRVMGADAVCMSTAPEALMAACLGLPVYGFALVANEAWRDEDDVTHADVLGTVQRRLPALRAVIGLAIGEVIGANE